MFAFNEDGCKVVCNVEDVLGLKGVTEDDKLKHCYTTNRAITLGTDTLMPGIDQDLGESGAGRSNLWSCAQLAWSFLASRPETVRHLVVLADGPDTCAKDGNEHFQHCFKVGEQDRVVVEGKAQPACENAVSYGAFRKRVTDVADLGRHDQHASFVQLQSRAHPLPDARMQELACLTGGHYRFLNFDAIAQETPERQTALLGAVDTLRTMLGGYWSVIASVPSLLGPVVEGVGPRLGAVQAVRGTLTVGPGNALLSAAHTPLSTHLRIGPEPNGGLSNLDDRLRIRRPCTAHSDCGPDTAPPCGVRCNPETLVCDAPASGSSCATPEGAGVCCVGSCLLGATLCDDAADPKSCP